MTPKEKAEELVNKLKPFMYCYKGSGMLTNTVDEGTMLSFAKQCALIAVEEVLSVSPSRRYWDTYDDETPSAITYWQEVKQEIEKL